MWRSEASLQEAVLSFHPVRPWDWTQIIRLGTSALPAEPSHQPHSPSFETKKLVSMKGEKLSLLITSTASEQDLTHLLNDTGHSGRYINKNKYRRAEALCLWCLEYPELSWSELYQKGFKYLASCPNQGKSSQALHFFHLGRTVPEFLTPSWLHYKCRYL